VDGPTPFDAKELGEFSLSEKGSATLKIGSHLLDGKVVDLPKPLIVAQKQQSSTEPSPALKKQRTDASSSSPSSPPSFSSSSSLPSSFESCSIEYDVIGVVKRKVLFKNRPKIITSSSALTSSQQGVSASRS